MRESRVSLGEVARVVRSALDNGERPVVAVVRTFGAPRPTAAGWIRRAKDAGLIPDVNYSTMSGLNATANQKTVAVAAALGVSPDQLREAVRVHAGGDLRLR